MITPNQIREKKISTVSTDGYDRNEVNELLVEIIESYEAICAENKELYRKMEILAGKIEEYREDEDSIKTAIISAQKVAHQVTAEAKEKAEQTIAESAQSAQQTVLDAKEKADKIIGEAREYVANLTREKTVAADEIMADAQSKANTVISSAKLVAQDTIDKAKQLTEELVSKAKDEKTHNQEIVAKLKAESKEFKSTLVSLYETQLSKLKDLTQSGAEPESVEALENELGAIISNINEASIDNIEVQEAVAVEAQTLNDAEADNALAEAETDCENDEPKDIEPDAADADEFKLDEVDEIINEIESAEPQFEEIEDDEELPPTEEEIANALNAFTENEITPVDDAVATIPVIEEEPEFENMQPFESFFNVDKTSVNTDETISLTAPDEKDEEDTAKFKGFFKKRK